MTSFCCGSSSLQPIAGGATNGRPIDLGLPVHGPAITQKLANPPSMFVSKGFRSLCHLNHTESQPIPEAFQPKPQTLSHRTHGWGASSPFFNLLPLAPPPFRPLQCRDLAFPITITFLQGCLREFLHPPTPSNVFSAEMGCVDQVHLL